MNVKIYHNPRCSKSREGLQLLQAQGIVPEVIEYLKTPLTADEIRDILQKLGISAREMMRTKEAEYKEHILDDPDLSDEDLIAAMVKMPKLIERPIVIANDKAVIGRPAENILSIL